MKKKTILFVHQSSELYGSDKTLLYLVKAFNQDFVFEPIVVLPDQGPLLELLEQENIKVYVLSVLKVSRKMFKLSYLLKLPFQAMAVMKELDRLLANETIDFVHSNTLAVLLGAIYSRRRKIKHIWHVHEIIEKPRLVSKLYPLIVDRFSDLVIYNSNASKTALCSKRKSLKTKSKVIWNGLDRDHPFTTPDKILEIRKELFRAKPKDVVIGLVGRINRWKGHMLLIKAFKAITTEFPNLKLVFVGSTPPGQSEFKDLVIEEIKALNLTDKCEIIPFSETIWPFYDSLDILVVPSTEPEPFGLVAVEGMLAKKLVIGANHGGLGEIIQDHETGLLFRPGDANDLSKTLSRAINQSKRSSEIADKGYIYAMDVFSLNKYVKSFKETYLNLNSIDI